jgi:hypothetical protein
MMGLGVATRNIEPIRPSTLVDTIAELKREFTRIQDELREARGEISRLRRKLGRRRLLSRAVSEIDIESLRRKVACFCHPDRGGDNELMSTINMLLDLFEVDESGEDRLADIREEREAA